MKYMILLIRVLSLIDSNPQLLNEEAVRVVRKHNLELDFLPAIQPCTDVNNDNDMGNTRNSCVPGVVTRL